MTPYSHLLQAQPTALVGRAVELEAIRQRLADEHIRLLTLTGPAGVGKTRLALAAAVLLAAHGTGRFPDGVLLVDLAPVREPPLVLGAIAHSLGLSDSGMLPLSERLREYLRERQVLLVLDNFEHVLPAAAELADLLAACLGLALLVTSRVPLRLRWEQALRIAPLPVPDLTGALPPPAALLAVPAVTLFVERAHARHGDFTLTAAQAPLVAQLVSQLDGLPLALELAAARLDALSLPLLTRRLADRLRLLRWEAPDLPERQQSLEAAIGWSYELLSAEEQRLFRCLGVFVGQVTLDAIATVIVARRDQESEAESVADESRTLDRLVSLAEKSLVLSEPPQWEPGMGMGMGMDGDEKEEPEPAFGMLETVREYAWEQLAAAGELAAARRAHAHYYVALAERADPLLRRHGQRAWFLRLEREHENLRAALRWLLEQDGPDGPAEHEAGLRLASALAWFWWLRGYHAEGSLWLEQALARAPHADPAVRTHALLGAGMLLIQQRDFARARPALEEALALAQQRQDTANEAKALSYLGACAVYTGEVAEGVRQLEAALARLQEVGGPHSTGLTLLFLGAAASAQGKYEESAALQAEALQRFQALGDTRLAGSVYYNLAFIAWQLGDLSRAVDHARAGLAVGVGFHDRRLLSDAARAALTVQGEQVEPARRARLLGAADTLSEATGPQLMFHLLPRGQNVVGLRERLEREGWGAAYHEGRSLTFGEVADLALSMLQEYAQALAAPGTARQTDQEEARQPLPRRASPLSEREQEVLRLVAQGLSNKAIGRQLFIAASTVNYHLTSVFHKLAVDTRAQAVAVAVQRGLL